LNKKVSIERCLKQINLYYAADSGIPFEADYHKQDAIATNLQRACELCIDIANHLIKSKKLGLPRDSGESFALLPHVGLIEASMAANPQTTVGFHNVLVHDYAELDLNLIVDVLEHHLRVLLDFADLALQRAD
jgi:uncharacterized protein YutE (UPF0331/DUF86 family)